MGYHKKPRRTKKTLLSLTITGFKMAPAVDAANAINPVAGANLGNPSYTTGLVFVGTTKIELMLMRVYLQEAHVK